MVTDRKEYMKKYNKKYYLNNKKYLKLLHHQYYLNNRDKVLLRIRKNEVKNKEHRKEQKQLYYLKNKDRILKLHTEYRKTDKGKIANRKCRAKRNRKLGHNPINKFFKNCHAHHINKDNVIYIPKELHQSIYHNVFTSQGMIEINSLAFTWLETSRR